jgi:hypothetical protein
MRKFKEHGRDAALEDIKEWLQARLPLQPITNFSHAPEHLRKKLLRNKVREFTEKNRWKFTWKKEFQSRLGMPYNAIVRGSNIILDTIEEALIRGESVRISNFGDFVPKTHASGKTVVFKPCKEWLRDLNPPTQESDVGLTRRANCRRLLERGFGV